MRRKVSRSDPKNLDRWIDSPPHWAVRDRKGFEYEWERVDDQPRHQIENPFFSPRQNLRLEAAHAALRERERRCLGLRAHRLDRLDEYVEELRSELALQALASKETADQGFVRYLIDGLCSRDVQ